MQKTVIRFVQIVIVSTLALNGYMLTPRQSMAFANTVENESKQEKDLVYKGKVVGISNKAKIIFLQVGQGDKSQAIELSFDENSVGVEHATKDHSVIISYEKREKIIYAKSIKPKPVNLPQGVSILQTAELKELLENGTDLVLVDSRPAKRYNQSHLPGAISVPTREIKELTELLPKDKSTKLVFYCGGPT